MNEILEHSSFKGEGGKIFDGCCSILKKNIEKESNYYLDKLKTVKTPSKKTRQAYEISLFLEDCLDRLRNKYINHIIPSKLKLFNTRRERQKFLMQLSGEIALFFDDTPFTEKLKKLSVSTAYATKE